AKKYHLFIISLAILLSFLFGILYYVSPFNLIFFVIYIPLIKHLRRVAGIENPTQFDKELKVIALSTLALAILMGIGHLL
ncbi:MAG: 1,4-dihydroxy-2-naphthoate polyprenyltransferase, partial [Mangrovimonas sp.]|nr:1,4-dihydroxy-2-naphthoate polyprenyltransferase [Mangrovimonas sp.]